MNPIYAVKIFSDTLDRINRQRIIHGIENISRIGSHEKGIHDVGPKVFCRDGHMAAVIGHKRKWQCRQPFANHVCHACNRCRTLWTENRHRIPPMERLVVVLAIRMEEQNAQQVPKGFLLDLSKPKAKKIVVAAYF